MLFPYRSYAADIQAVLDTSDGSSGMVVQDSTNAAHMRILSNGNVGIGTVSPTGSLEIQKNGTVAPVLVSSSASNHGDYMVVTSGGNVGIGAATPLAKFNVNTGTNQNLVVRPGSDFSSSNGVALQSVDDAGTTLKQITLRASDVLTNGNIGIGTTGPRMALEVQGNGVRIGNGTFDHASGSGDLYVTGNLEVDGSTYLGDNAAVDNLVVMGHFTQTGTTDFDTLEIRNSEFVGTAGGNLGIGTTAAHAGLEIQEQSSHPLLMLSSAANTNGDYVVVNSSGNVGIGSTAPSDKLDVNGTIRVGLGTFNNPSGTNSDLYVTGNLEVDGSSYLGDNAAVDNLVVNGKMTMAGGMNLDSLEVTGNTFLASTSGNLGVGTTAAHAGVEIQKRGANPLLMLSSSATGMGDYVMVDSGGNVGIGTIAPIAPFQIASTVNSPIGGINITGSSSIDNVTLSLTNNGTGGRTWWLDSTGRNSTWNQGRLAIGYGTSWNAPVMSLTGAGNVGIGSTAPSDALDVNGTVRVGLGTFNNPSGNNNDLYVSGNLEVDGSSWLGDNAAVDNLTVNGRMNMVGGMNLDSLEVTGNTNLATASGNVGIGTTLTGGNAKFAVIGGNVGIGTAVPGKLLSNTSTVIQDANGIGVSSLGLLWGTPSNSGTSTYIGAFYNPGSGTNRNVLLLKTPASTNDAYLLQADSGSNSVFNINASGNVGIGSLAPSDTLDVNGTVRIGLGTFNNPSGNNNDLYVTGNLEVDGSAWLGDNASVDNLTVNGKMNMAGGMNLDQLEVTGNTFLGTSSGNLGIGTTAAHASIEVKKSGTNPMLMLTSSATGQGDVMTVDSAGNVGIGTNTPQGGVAILNGNVGIGTWVPSAPLEVVNNGSGDWLRLNRAGTRQWAFNAVNGYFNIVDNTDSSAKYFTISNTGNVGLGTTKPAGGLAVLSGNVGIGTFAPLGMLEVRGGPVRIGTGTVDHVSGDGDLYVGNNLEVDGSVWLGDATTDNLTVTGRMNMTGGMNLDTLEVMGNTNLATASGNVGVGTTMTGANAKFAVLGGNVGIGTTTPQGGLVVMNGNVGIGTWVPAAGLDVENGNVAIGNSAVTTEINFGGGRAQIGFGATNAIFQAGPARGIQFGVNNSTFVSGAVAVISSAGNVGIGSLAPSDTLDVNGTERIGLGTFDHPSGNNNDLYVSGNFEVDGNVWLGDATTDNLTVTGRMNLTGGETLDTLEVTGVTNLATVSGNVGIGTTGTGGDAKLAVMNGNVGLGTVTAEGGLIVMNGNVGIGTWKPSTKFVLVTGTNNDDFTLQTTNNNNNLGIGFMNQSGNYVWRMYRTPGAVTNHADLRFSNGQSGLPSSLTDMVTFQDGGNVGIGSTAPSDKLDVNGTERIGLGTFNNPSGNNNDLYVSGNLEVDGSVWLGDATTDNLTITGKMNLTGGETLDSLEVTGNTFLGTSSGNLGVGTTAAHASLEIQKSGSNPALMVSSTATGLGDYLMVDSVGNVGIGTSNPNSKLSVIGSLRTVGGQIQAWNSANTSGVSIQTDNQSSTAMTFNTGAAEHMRISAGGNVGIGTVNPLSQLVVAGSGVGIGTNFNSSFLQTSAPSGGLITEGNVGVGTFNPVVRLVVRSVDNGSATNIFETKSNNGIAGLAFGYDAIRELQSNHNIDIDANGTGNLLLQTSSTGNVGIGSASPSDTLDVNGTERIGLGTFNNPSGNNNDLYVSGNLEVDGSVWLGDAAADNLTVTGKMNFTGGETLDSLEVTGNTFLGTSSGNLGVGTTAAHASVEIQKSGTNPLLMVSSSATGAGDYMLINSTGNVGIGTIGPALVLDVRGSAGRPATTGTAQSGIARFGYTGGNVVLDIGINSTGSPAAWIQPTRRTDLSQQYDLSLNPNGGNIGIGTLFPANKLAVVGAGSGVGIGTGANSPFVTVSAPNGGLIVEGNVGIGTTIASNGGLLIMNGNVGIGTWVPGKGLDVKGDVRSSNNVSVGNSITDSSDNPRITITSTSVDVNLQ